MCTNISFGEVISFGLQKWTIYSVLHTLVDENCRDLSAFWG